MSLTILDSVLSQVEHLSFDEKLVVLEKLASSVRSESPTAPTMPKSGRRIIGLFAGKGEMWMADDFDAPLPDSFWFGEEEEGF